jgi:tetratricopeptide (TPR) repeat protein
MTTPFPTVQTNTSTIQSTSPNTTSPAQSDSNFKVPFGKPARKRNRKVRTVTSLAPSHVTAPTPAKVINAATTIPTATLRPLLQSDLYKKARLLIDEGQCSSAVSLLVEAIKSGVEDLLLKTEILKDIARCYTVLEAPENGLWAYERLLEIEPENPEYLMQKGVRLFALNRWQEAQEVLEKSDRILPKQALVLRLLGQCYMEAGLLDIAEHYLKEALEMKKETIFYPHYLKPYIDCLNRINNAS